MSDSSLQSLRRQAKQLKKAHVSGEAKAQARVQRHFPNAGQTLKHADYLHVVARELDFDSWPKLKFAIEQQGLDRLSRQRLLRHALFHGQHWKVQSLLAETPDLPEGSLGAQIALYDLEAVRSAIRSDNGLAIREVSGRRPIVHLAFSKHIKAEPDKRDDMLALAGLLLENGADVNDFMPAEQSGEHSLSVLYGAVGHGDNMDLARWLLENGADPNDGESLYHATELGHHQGLDMLLAHGADPKGTNALLRALDFNDHRAVKMLLAAGAVPDDFNGSDVGGEAPYVIPALHQAARRLNDRAMVELLLDAGADPHGRYQGVSAYGFARVIGNTNLVEAIEARGLVEVLTAEEEILARAADGMDQPGVFLDVEKLPDSYRDILIELINLPDKFAHIQRLVALGIEYDRADVMGVPPVQLAGWNGLPELMDYFLRLGPDLSHVNKYGGTLLGTILHGAENCPQRAERDHMECARLALHHGVVLPRAALEWTGDQDLADFLQDWAQDKPGQVV